MADGRAKVGGEVGKNGEFYKGGTFLPNTTNPKRTPTKRGRGTGRVLIEPGVFDVAPEGKISIFMQVRNFVALDGARLVRSQPDDHAAIAYYWSERGVEALNDLIERYNAGERFA